MKSYIKQINGKKYEVSNDPKWKDLVYWNSSRTISKFEGPYRELQPKDLKIIREISNEQT